MVKHTKLLIILKATLDKVVVSRTYALIQNAFFFLPHFFKSFYSFGHITCLNTFLSLSESV